MKFTDIIRRAAAASCLSSGTPIGSIAAQAGVHPSTVRRWVRDILGPAKYRELLAQVKELSKH